MDVNTAVAHSISGLRLGNSAAFSLPFIEELFECEIIDEF